MWREPQVKNGASYPRRYRLTKTDEFSSVFGFRKALRSPHFLLHWRTRTVAEAQYPRLGLVVAKKLLPRAVDRNLIRRLTREHFRLLRQGLPARDLILRLANRPAELDRKLLAAEIRGLLGKLMEPIR
ncbi:MAG: ribonuclease P protein component [Propionivibrio sp.]|jgi:ribonuclease P protein component|nr:ribonuclease P protein component [Propionivibrio sp.]